MNIADIRQNITNLIAEKGVGKITPRRLGSILSNMLEHLQGEIDSIEVTGGGGDAATIEEITSNIQVGAAASGKVYSKGTTLTEFIKAVSIQEIAATVSISCTPSSSGYTLEGTTKSITLKAKATAGTAKSLTSISFYKGDTLIETLTNVTFGTEVTCSTVQDITTTTSFHAEIAYKDSTNTSETNSSGTATFKYTRYSYWGSVDEGVTPTAALISAFTNKQLVGTKTETLTTTANKVFVYAYPKSFGALTKIDDGVLEYTSDFNSITIQIDSVEYYVYYLKKVNGSAMTYNFK